MSNLTAITGDACKLPLADKSVNLIITHPPYYKVDPFRYGGNPKLQINFGLKRKRYVKLMVKAIREMERVLVEDGSIWIGIGSADAVDYSILSRILEKTSLKLGGVIVHDYSTDYTTNYVQSDTITIWAQLVKSPDFFSATSEVRQYGKAVWKFPFNNMENPVDLELSKKYHVLDAVNQELPYRLIKMYSKAGDVVLDPFGGSGVIPVIAAMLSRKAISNDISTSQKEVLLERARLSGVSV